MHLLPHRIWVGWVSRPRLRYVPVLHNTASIKAENIRNRYRHSSIRILSKMDISRIVVESGMHDCEVGDCSQARQGADGLIQRPWRRVGTVLNPLRREMIFKGGLDVLVEVELLDEFVEDRDLLRVVGWSRRTVACRRSDGQKGQKNVELHVGVMGLQDERLRDER